MRLWKVLIRTYYFGNLEYDLFVLADTESSMIKAVYDHSKFRKDEDAEIIGYREIDLNDTKNRVL